MELSIVIMIVSILVAGALSVVTNNTMDKKVKNTNAKINQIYEALKVYVAKNSKLPCPASILAIKATDINYGTSVGTDGNCSGTGIYYIPDNINLMYGMIPVQTLGLSLDMAEDDFGSKIAYIVEQRFTSPPTPTNSPTTYPFNSNGIISIVENIDNPDTQTVSSTKIVTYTKKAIFTIISYGPNKSGAFPINSATQNTISSNPFESANSKINDNLFLKGNLVFSKVQNSDVFDDIVFYKTRDDLISDSGAFNLMTCTAESISIDFASMFGFNADSKTYAWSDGKYNQIVASDTACPSGYKQTVAKPTRMCGPLGKWQNCCVDYCFTNTSSSCTGGIITTFTDSSVTPPITRRVHTFLNSGTFKCPSNQNIDILVVGGGGGGTTYYCGGGGGGGGAVIYKTDLSITAATNYSVEIGSGGLRTTNSNGNNGGDSKFKTTSDIIVAKGGGGGGYGPAPGSCTSTTTAKGSNGGSGGGGGMASGASSGGTVVANTYPAGSTVYGNAGGGSSTAQIAGGGGGGAVSSGGTGTSGTNGVGGKGGDGVQIAIAGISPTPYYGSGGGGSTYLTTNIAKGGSYGNVSAGGNGGYDGRGSAGYIATDAVNGYGGGGGGGNAGGGRAGNGGSGVVIIAYTVTP